jgi:hypothetical protein
MNAIDLFSLSDDLLSGCVRDPSAPHYTDRAFRRKLRAARRREAFLPSAPPSGEVAYLFDREWGEIIAQAGLTARQWEVVAMRVAGHTFEEIGSLNQATRQGALSVYQRALRKILRVANEYPFRGLCEIYRIETAGRRRTSSNSKLIA